MNPLDIPGQLSDSIAWTVRRADRIVLTAAIVIAIIAVIRTLQKTSGQPLSKRLLPVSVAVATGLSAEGMWVTAEKLFHLTGLVRVGLFAFGEIAILSAAAAGSEAYDRLLQLAKETPDSDAEKKIHESRRISALREARFYTGAVWGIAIGIGLLAGSVTPNTAEKIGRLAPAIIVALFWYGGINKSGVAVTREAITSRISLRRLAVRLHLAQAGAVGLEEEDRNRCLERLSGRLYAYHQTTDATLARRFADWRLGRADAAARRYLDPEGRVQVAEQLAARFTLRTGTSQDALSALDPWRTDRLTIRSPRADSGRVIDGQVIGQPTPDTTPSAADRTADSPPRTVRPQRTVVPIAERRTAASNVADMASWLSGQFPDRLPGRPTVQAALRGQFGSCSTDRAIEVLSAVRSMRAAATQSLETSSAEQPDVRAVNE